MIKLVDEKLVDRYLSYCSDNPFGIRMAAALKSYGTDCRFADFWLVYDEENVVGAVSKLDDDLTLCADIVTDELCAFIFTIGGHTLTAERSVLEEMGIDSFSCEGAIMRYIGAENIEVCLPIDTSPSIMGVCKLLCDCEGDSIKVGQLDRFYTDLALRVRRGTAICYAYEDKGVAVASAVTDYGAVVGGVAVRENERRSGVGSSLVKRLVSDLPQDKKIYLLRLENENESFYKGLGFDNVGSWASITRGCE